MEFWLGSVALGLGYGFLAIGVYVTMRVFNFPDITADGSLTLGASLSAALLVSGTNVWIAMGLSMLAGFAAGAATGLIHTKFRVNGLLSGILVTTGLYSINLRIMGRSNVPLLNVKSILTPIEKFLPTIPKVFIALVYFAILVALVWFALRWLFRTNFGLAMRATGDNEIMIAAQGVNTDTMKIIGLGLSNALIALSGSVVAQYQGFADIGMGIGIIVFGLASVIIGESLTALRKQRPSIAVQLLAVIAGTIIFRLLVAVALSSGLDPIDLKLITALFVLLAVGLPQLRTALKFN
jgi:putative tryptophan/tyrosine transport system permease protein